MAPYLLYNFHWYSPEVLISWLPWVHIFLKKKKFYGVSVSSLDFISCHHFSPCPTIALFLICCAPIDRNRFLFGNSKYALSVWGTFLEVKSISFGTSISDGLRRFYYSLCFSYIARLLILFMFVCSILCYSKRNLCKWHLLGACS